MPSRGRHQVARARAAPAGEERHQHQPDREHVGARVDPAVVELLGRHEGRGAAGRRRGLGLAQARQPEVEEHQALAAAGLDHHRVGRLDVGVDQAGLVGRGQPGQELPGQRDRPRRRQRSVGAQRGQGRPAQQLHRVEQPPVVADVGLIDAHDVGMIEAPDRADLVEEQPTIGAGRIEVVVEELDRDVAIDRELARAIDRAEGAAGQLLVEAEPPGQDRADAGDADRRRRRCRPAPPRAQELELRGHGRRRQDRGGARGRTAPGTRRGPRPGSARGWPG
jgi:hypothetical protein